MSLDVTLTLKGANIERASSAIFIREGGQTREISEEEWNERNPDREPVRAVLSEPSDEVYTANITHNLTTMADAADLYNPLWNPEELKIVKAGDLIVPLAKGLSVLVAQPKFFKQYNPPNGWGTYEGLVEFARNYLNACIAYPEATVSVCK